MNIVRIFPQAAIVNPHKLRILAFSIISERVSTKKMGPLSKNSTFSFVELPPVSLP